MRFCGRWCLVTTETLRLSLEPSLSAPRQAREALRQWLEQSSCDVDQRGDLLLVISELVTNAVVHTGLQFEVLASFDDGRIRLEVHDLHQVLPIERAAGDRVGQDGWGLRLVGAVTDGWGWNQTPTGKVVWTETLC